MQVAAGDFEAILRTAKKALIIGVGGGGDIVGTSPTARFLELFGIGCVLGGLSWERFVYDPQPGTRILAEVTQARALAPTVWLANAQTTTANGIRFAESDVAGFYDTETLMIDLSQGTPGVVAGLRTAMRELEADLLVGIDVGGDSLATGSEPGLRSPLADAIMLAALHQLQDDYACVWGVFGYGSDAELTPQEIDQALSTVAAHGGLLGAWGMTPAITAELQRVISHVRTEASAIAVACAQGAFGTQTIRGGTRTVPLSPVCTVTFYLSPGILFKHVATLAQAVCHATSLQAASSLIENLGVRSEYAFEQAMWARGAQHYGDAV